VLIDFDLVLVLAACSLPYYNNIFVGLLSTRWSWAGHKQAGGG